MSDEFTENFRKFSGDDFFNLLESHFKTVIPTIIKKNLDFCDYNCAIVLAKLDDERINAIEGDIRNTFDDELKRANETKEDYLGRFSECQSKFKFLDGQRTWLKLIGQTCRQVLGITESSTVVVNAGETSSQSVSENSVGRSNKHSRDSLLKLIGAQMLTVFNDAKRITLSAWSWPSREVSSQLAAQFKATGTINGEIDLLYATPSHHADLLNCIVQIDLERFKSSLSTSLAMSLRIDGSVDRSQKHNVYVLIHVVTQECKVKTFFLGFDIPVGNSALSYQIVTKTIANDILDWDLLLSITTSLVTDGEPKNTGCLTGLWQRLREEKEEISNGPFITIWCVGHRVNLGWKATCELGVIKGLLNNVSSVASYFHQSGERTRLLEAIAIEKNLNKPLHYPQHFDIRWQEFTHNLLYVFLRNWNVMIWHFKSTNETAFENMWLSGDRIRMATFVCDILTVLKIFQKTFQSNSISILHLPSRRKTLIDSLGALKITPLVNGWEEKFLKEMTTSADGSIYLRDHKLLTSDRLRSGPFTFSTNDRSNIIDFLIQNLNVYFDEDVDIQNGLAPLLELDPDVTSDLLDHCQSIIVPEMEFEDFSTEYYEAANLLTTEERKTPLENVLKLEQTCSKEFKAVKTALARGYAIKPHSADVENIINVYNKYKDTDRQLLSPRTLFNNIYVHTNMPTLIEFDPTAAAEKWLNDKQRKPRIGTKSTQQEWFKGVFPEAENYERHSSRKIEF